MQTTVDDVVASEQAAEAEEQANRAFSVSMLISAVRCTLTYVVFPWVFPAIHAGSSRVGPTIGLVVGATALTSNVFSIRRFHRSGHRYRWPVTAINVAIIVLVSILVAQDIADLL